jgi:L-2-hydroxyglutarate oxidase
VSFVAPRVAIVGAGIVGLATAYRLLEKHPRARVVLLEKESDVGQHQSTHNSGVLHAGLHYRPASLKARLAVQGIRAMVHFCEQHGVAHERCGKLVVATDAAELPRLRELQTRGVANGLRGLRWLERGELTELEPHVAGIAGLHVPEEGIVDYAAVCATLRRLVQERGGEVRTGFAVDSIERRGDGWRVRSIERELSADLLITCAGLHADRIAKLAGEVVEERVIPFRGEYWLLRPEKRSLVRNLIYPVPDPTFPFLGVHLTRTVSGAVEAGPNAVLALAREGYTWRDVDLRDMFDSVRYRGLWRFLMRYPSVATYEVARSLSASLFLRSLQRLVPDLRRHDLVPGPSGVRAQLVARDGTLVHDFALIERPGAVHVLSAPSPAATASLAIGGEIVRLIEPMLRA